MREIPWDQVLKRLDDFADEHLTVPPVRLYGVPRGGAILVGLLQSAGHLEHVEVVENPRLASVALDDVEDSGATRARYSMLAPNALFVPLFKRQAGEPYLHFPWEATDSATENADHVRRLLQCSNAPPEVVQAPGMLATPKRYLRALQELTEGYKLNAKSVLATRFDAGPNPGLVVVRNIPFHSLCEHHLLPFSGTVTVGYLPGKCVVGLSKIPRLVAMHARRFQMQERLTEAIALDLDHELNARGTAVVSRARHTCMAIRGVKSEAEMVTSTMYGELRDAGPLRSEFLELAGGPRS